MSNDIKTLIDFAQAWQASQGAAPAPAPTASQPTSAFGAANPATGAPPVGGNGIDHAANIAGLVAAQLRGMGVGAAPAPNTTVGEYYDASRPSTWTENQTLEFLRKNGDSPGNPLHWGNHKAHKALARLLEAEMGQTKILTGRKGR